MSLAGTGAEETSVLPVGVATASVYVITPADWEPREPAVAGDLVVLLFHPPEVVVSVTDDQANSWTCATSSAWYVLLRGGMPTIRVTATTDQWTFTGRVFRGTFTGMEGWETSVVPAGEGEQG